MEQIHKVAATLHLLNCRRPHSEGGCQWYFELQHSECLEMPEHKRWEEQVKELSATGGVELGPLEQLLHALFRIIGDVKNVTGRFPLLQPFIKQTIERVL